MKDIYHNILDNVLAGYWTWDVVHKKIFFSTGFKSKLGYKDHELENTPETWMNLVEPAYRQHISEICKKYLKEPGNHPINFEAEYQHKDGSKLWLYSTGKPSAWDKNNQPTHITGCYIDISEGKAQEQEQNNQLAHYRQLMEKTNHVARIGTWEVDLQTNTPIWSQVTREIHEVDDEFTPDMEIAINFYPEGYYREKVTELVNNAIEKGTSFDVELQIITAKNNIKWVRTIGIPEFVNNTCKRLYGIFQDITEKKMAEIEIKNSLDRNRIFIEQSPNAIAMVDTQMRFLAVSEKWIEDYRLAGKKIKGASFYDVFPKMEDCWKNIHEECLKGNTSQCDEMAFRQPDGSTRWLSWDIRPWYISANKIGGLILHTSDITDRKNDSLRLAHSEELFRQTFENAAIGIALVSLEGQWLKVNQQVCDIVGYSETELLQKTFQDITHPEDLNVDLEYLIQLLNNEIPYYQMEKRYFHKDGSIVWVLLAVSLVKDKDGTPLHFISQIKDINKRKKAFQQLEEAHEVVKEQNNRLLNFAHIVSHNLRSHTGNLEMMLQFFDSETDQKEKEILLENIIDISTSLSETIQHLNQVVQIQTKSEDTKEKVNLKHFLDKAINTLQADLRKTQGKIYADISRNTEINFNPAYLDSILLNFLTNALKYRHDFRKPLVNIWTEEKDNFLVLFIQDNGIGIDLTKHGEKLFGLYKTFHDHADARGVGLFITRNQVEAMGGKIKVESTPGEGTTFEIHIAHEKDKAYVYH